jgi:DNA-binding transcriptional MerR regulator
VDLMSIGEFAGRARLSPKALRLYDELGLLPPARVDDSSGYRSYDPAQLDQARLIAALRQLQLPLSEIKVLLQLEPTVAAQRLRDYWAAVEVEHSARRELAGYLVDRLSGETSVMYEVTTRDIPTRSLLCLKRNTPGEGAAWALGEEFIAVLRRHELPRVEGPASASAGERSLTTATGPSSGAGPFAMTAPRSSRPRSASCSYAPSRPTGKRPSISGSVARSRPPNGGWSRSRFTPGPRRMLPDRASGSRTAPSRHGPTPPARTASSRFRLASLRGARLGGAPCGVARATRLPSRAGGGAPSHPSRNLHSTTIPARMARPVVLCMLFMHSSTGLGSGAGVVVLCRFPVTLLAQTRAATPWRQPPPRPGRAPRSPPRAS